MDSDERFGGPSGWRVVHLGETGSTNDLARDAGRTGAPDRSVFVADHQTGGRGRMDRPWLAPPGSSLLFTILFRRHASRPMLLTMLCSVAAAEAIGDVAGAHVEIKWPNDLMLNGGKLAGVLTEVSGPPSKPFAVVGMGINVNFDPAAVPGIPDSATSLLRETGAPTSRARLLHEILRHLDALLATEEVALEPAVRARWAARLWRRHQRVTLANGSTVLKGVFEGVAEDGALLLRLDDESLRAVRTGDLRV